MRPARPLASSSDDVILSRRRFEHTVTAANTALDSSRCAPDQSSARIAPAPEAPAHGEGVPCCVAYGGGGARRIPRLPQRILRRPLGTDRRPIPVALTGFARWRNESRGVALASLLRAELVARQIVWRYRAWMLGAGHAPATIKYVCTLSSISTRASRRPVRTTAPRSSRLARRHVLPFLTARIDAPEPWS